MVGRERVLTNPLEKEISDGILLVQLLDVLFEVTVKYNPQIQSQIQKMKNINFALDGLKSVGIETRGIGAAGNIIIPSLYYLSRLYRLQQDI